MLQYTSTIKSRPYLYLEFKKAAQLNLQGFNSKQIKEMAVEENIFLANTEARKKEIASVVTNRIKELDDYILDKIVNGSVQTSKQLAHIAF